MEKKQNTKKPFIILLITAAVILLFGLKGCGDILHAETISVASEKFSQDDISQAVRTIKADFFRNYNDCTLLTIRYAGDSRQSDSSVNRQWGGDENITILISFSTGKASSQQGFQPDMTYENWSVIMVREKGANWRIVNSGLG